MSYFSKGPAVYFGESAASDRWIQENIPGAEPESAPRLDLSREPTEVGDGVWRYHRAEAED